jgi:hypothetical protein
MNTACLVVYMAAWCGFPFFSQMHICHRRGIGGGRGSCRSICVCGCGVKEKICRCSFSLSFLTYFFLTLALSPVAKQPDTNCIHVPVLDSGGGLAPLPVFRTLLISSQPRDSSCWSPLQIRNKRGRERKKEACVTSPAGASLVDTETCLERRFGPSRVYTLFCSRPYFNFRVSFYEGKLSSKRFM